MAPADRDTPRNAPKLQSLDMLRGVAALLVMLYHTGAIFGTRTGHDVFGGAFAAGTHGVDLFFVLSGFVITYVHRADWGRPHRLGGYLLRRASRIYPAVWIMTALAVAAYLAGTRLGVAVGLGEADQSPRLGAWSIVASTLLLPQPGVPLVNVTWTLKFEIFFYAVFALLIVERRCLALLVLWQATVFGAMLAGLGFGEGWGWYFAGPMCLEFGIGMASAWLVRHRDAMPALARPALPAAALLLSTLLLGAGAVLDTPRWGGRSAVSDLVVYGVGSGLVVAALALLELSGRLRSWRVLVELGEASYSIYLVHFSVVTVVSGAVLRLGAPAGPGIGFAVAATGVLAGIAFHRGLDRPIQRRLRRRTWERRLPDLRARAVP